MTGYKNKEILYLSLEAAYLLRSRLGYWLWARLLNGCINLSCSFIPKMKEPISLNYVHNKSSNQSVPSWQQAKKYLSTFVSSYALLFSQNTAQLYSISILSFSFSLLSFPSFIISALFSSHPCFPFSLLPPWEIGAFRPTTFLAASLRCYFVF